MSSRSNIWQLGLRYRPKYAFYAFQRFIVIFRRVDHLWRCNAKRAI